jgi:hypothetical protein
MAERPKLGVGMTTWIDPVPPVSVVVGRRCAERADSVVAEER